MYKVNTVRNETRNTVGFRFYNTVTRRYKHIYLDISTYGLTDGRVSEISKGIESIINNINSTSYEFFEGLMFHDNYNISARMVFEDSELYERYMSGVIRREHIGAVNYGTYIFSDVPSDIDTLERMFHWETHLANVRILASTNLIVEFSTLNVRGITFSIKEESRTKEVMSTIVRYMKSCRILSNDIILVYEGREVPLFQEGEHGIYPLIIKASALFSDEACLTGNLFKHLSERFIKDNIDMIKVTIDNPSGQSMHYMLDSENRKYYMRDVANKLEEGNESTCNTNELLEVINKYYNNKVSNIIFAVNID